MKNFLFRYSSLFRQENELKKTKKKRIEIKDASVNNH